MKKIDKNSIIEIKQPKTKILVYNESLTDGQLLLNKLNKLTQNFELYHIWLQNNVKSDYELTTNKINNINVYLMVEISL